MKKFLISTAVAAVTSTSAFAQGPTSVNINVAPIMNITTQVANAVGIIVAPNTVVGGTGSTTSAQSISQTVTATNINGTNIFSGIGFHF